VMNCRLCGGGLESEDEREYGLCDDCMRDGMSMLGKVLRKMKKRHLESEDR